MKRALISAVQYTASRIPGWMMPKKFKYTAEYWYWKSRKLMEGESLKTGWYQAAFNKAAGLPEDEDNWTEGKVVADFGCGPRGSLVWASKASRRIGIDVLVPQYRKLGIDKHDMEYFQSTETEIPLGTSEVDVLTTLNAIDHVMDFPAMCGELLRILKPGGMFIAAINLEEAPTFCEPQTLTMDMTKTYLLDHLEIENERIETSHKGRKLYIRAHKPE